jgi:hypothetical protein
MALITTIQRVEVEKHYPACNRALDSRSGAAVLLLKLK